MSYRLVADTRAAYLYLRLEGNLVSGEVQPLAKRVIDEYKHDPRPALLVDVRELRMNVDVLTTIRLVGALPRLAKGIRAPTAVVYGNDGHDVVRFYETVAMNRGYMTRIFPAIGPALDWIGG